MKLRQFSPPPKPSPSAGMTRHRGQGGKSPLFVWPLYISRFSDPITRELGSPRAWELSSIAGSDPGEARGPVSVRQIRAGAGCGHWTASLLARRSTDSWCLDPEKLLSTDMSQLDANAVQRAIALAVVIFLVQRVVSGMQACSKASRDILFGCCSVPSQQSFRSSLSLLASPSSSNEVQLLRRRASHSTFGGGAMLSLVWAVRNTAC